MQEVIKAARAVDVEAARLALRACLAVCQDLRRPADKVVKCIREIQQRCNTAAAQTGKARDSCNAVCSVVQRKVSEGEVHSRQEAVDYRSAGDDLWWWSVVLPFTGVGLLVAPFTAMAMKHHWDRSDELQQDALDYGVSGSG
ncbi:hypothetical protein WJX73_001213 [Symbiochloris irregularis]|uniref:Uncharacterized protein n=1 Tax=Symbiochloris irregularis TaxID=706552 RepID=A0AAW1P3C0_9CHLO